MALKSLILLVFLAFSIRLLIRHRIFVSRIFPRILLLTPAVAGLIVVIFYAFTAFTSRHLPEVGPTPYSDLAQAFRHGHLYFDLLPSPELLSLSDPYDPVLNAPYRYHDVSLYNGKYYLYFGPLPAVLLFLPAQLFGLQMTGYIACFIFGTLLLMVQSLIVVKSIGKRVFNHPVLLSATIMLLGFGSVTPMLLRRPAMYEIAILTGALFLSCSILCLVLSLRSNTAKFKWGCASIIFSFCAFWTRPSHIVAPFIILLLFVFVLSENRRQKTVYLSVAALFSLLICSYNFLRFKSIFEIGIHYQLNGFNMRFLPRFNLDWIKPKLFGDLLTLPEYVPTFPWLNFGRPTYLTALGGLSLEPSIGLLIFAPWLIPVFALFIIHWRNIYNEDRKLLLIIIFAGISAIAAFTVQMLVNPGETYRYLGDYAPFIFLATSLFSLFTILRLPTRNFFLSLAMSICLLFTVTTVGLLSFTGYYNPLGF